MFVTLELVRARYSKLSAIDGPLNDLARFLRTSYPGPEFNSKCLEFTDMDAVMYMRYQALQKGAEPQNGSRAPPTRSGKTQRNYYFACRQLFEFMVMRGLITRNPFDAVRPPKKGEQKRRKRFIEPEQVQAMLDMASDRDRAAFACFFGGALRISEVLRLDLCDVWLSDYGVVLNLRQTKNWEYAEQLLPDWAGQIVWMYTEARRVYAGTTDPVFVREDRAGKGRRLGDQGLLEAFKRAAMLAGISGWIASHSARATAITTLLRKGLPHRRVMHFSRHKSVAMVEQYDVDDRRLSEHPGAELDYKPDRTSERYRKRG